MILSVIIRPPDVVEILIFRLRLFCYRTSHFSEAERPVHEKYITG